MTEDPLSYKHSNNIPRIIKKKLLDDIDVRSTDNRHKVEGVAVIWNHWHIAMHYTQ